MSHLKKDNILEFINRNIVYKIPETITVAGILYLIKDTIMGASCVRVQRRATWMTKDLENSVYKNR